MVISIQHSLIDLHHFHITVFSSEHVSWSSCLLCLKNVSHRNVITCQWWVHTTPGDLSPRGARSSLFLLWARERARTNGSKDCIYCRSAGWGRNPWTLVDFRCLPSSAKPLRSWRNFADWGLDGCLDLPTTFWTGSVCVLDLWPQCFVCHKRRRRGGSVTWNVVDFH